MKLLLATLAILCAAPSLSAQRVDDLCPNASAKLDSISFPETAPAVVESGLVNVGFTVHSDGSVADVAVVSSSDPSLEQSAIAAVSRLSCLPQPTDVRLSLPVNFVRPLKLTADLCPNYPTIFRSVGYPRTAIVQGIRRGNVLVDFTILADGQVLDIDVIRSSNEAFAKVAVNALAQLKCAAPGRTVRVRVPFGFRLN